MPFRLMVTLKRSSDFLDASNDPIRHHFMRINKHIAQSGYCSRRRADELVLAGKVLVNDRVVKEVGTQIDPEHDVVRVKGGPTLRPRSRRKNLLLLMHKPKGYVCTKRAQAGQRTVFELLPPEYQHLNTVGRLDKDSEGVLLFTNDGELSNRLTHPKYGKEKVYIVTVRGRVVDKDLQQIRKGMRLISYSTAPALAKLISYQEQDDRSVLEIVLREGKKRQIRNMFLALKKPVKKLVRVRFGEWKVGKMKPGDFVEVKRGMD